MPRSRMLVLAILPGAILLGASLRACADNTAPGPALPSPGPALPAPPERGTVIGAGASVVPVVLGAGNTVNRLEPRVFSALLAAQTGAVLITGTPKCAITAYSVQYRTVGGLNEATDASAAIMLPSGSDAACSGPRPLLLYAHGTTVAKSFSMAKLNENGEARLVAAMFAAQGYIVVAPNYVGYDTSSLRYHPYLNGEQQANDMIDALRAARRCFDAIGANASSALFLTGYSQGGYVALATQRAMQTQYASEFSVTRAAGLSGPYALLQFVDTIFGGSPTRGVTAFLPLLINAGQKSNTGVYASSSDVYEAQYANGIETLLPGSFTTGDLVRQGRLPATALFARDSLPQGAGAGNFFADHNLIKTSYRSDFLADLAARPCNVDPAAPLACSPQNGLRKLSLKNDLRSYLPAAPLLLCGGRDDPIVPFSNTDAAVNYFRANGMGRSALTVVDLESFRGFKDPFLRPKLGFSAAKLLRKAEAYKVGKSGAQAVSSGYHAGLVAPFCLMAARNFFQAALP